jgi:hypothetical protein
MTEYYQEIAKSFQRYQHSYIWRNRRTDTSHDTQYETPQKIK